VVAVGASLATALPECKTDVLEDVQKLSKNCSTSILSIQNKLKNAATQVTDTTWFLALNSPLRRFI
jgi:hypothetical protein